MRTGSPIFSEMPNLLRTEFFKIPDISLSIPSADMPTKRRLVAFCKASVETLITVLQTKLCGNMAIA